jgi:hypothetical protein
MATSFLFILHKRNYMIITKLIVVYLVVDFVKFKEFNVRIIIYTSLNEIGFTHSINNQLQLTKTNS